MILNLPALITHLDLQSEIMCESRLNCSNPSEIPDREEDATEYGIFKGIYSRLGSRQES